MKRVTGSLIGLCVLSSLLLTTCSRSAEEAGGVPGSRHPVIVIAVDGLRADYLGCYGAEGLSTPNFDALAAESVRFEWAFAQAADPAVSLVGLLTGLYPTTSGVREAGGRLPVQAATLAEAVDATGMFAAAYFEGIPDGDDYGLGQGFTHFEMGPTPGDAAMDWLRGKGESDFLLVFRGWSVDTPFSPEERLWETEPPEGFFERIQEMLLTRAEGEAAGLELADLEFARTLYAARIKSLDNGLGDLMGILAENGLADRATLIVLATSGFDLQEHGVVGSDTLHTQVTRVPLFIRFPRGRVVDTVDRIVEVTDLMPTILDLVGAETPPGVQGKSLVPIIGGVGTPPYIAFSESPFLGGQRAVALGGYHLLFFQESGIARLYDLATDPDELRDLADAESSRKEVMLRHLEAWEKMVTASSLDPELRSEEELDDETLEQLRSLGYIQ